MLRLGAVLAAIGIALAAAPQEAAAGAVLDTIKVRGELNCGVRGDTDGFARKDDKGKFTGFEVDICRAIAAAILGNADKVKFFPLEVARRFPALQNGQVDVLVSGTTYTMSRALTGGLDFVAVYYYDSQAFMVPRKLGKKSLKDLSGNTICVQSGTTSAENAEDYFRQNKMTYSPVSFDKLDDMRTAFLAGRCDALTADRSAVYASRVSYAGNPSDFLVLPESPSREPLGLIVKPGDPAFREVVRWSLYAMVEAEENGIRSGNVDEMLNSDSSKVKRLLGTTPGMGKALGVDEKWAYTIIKQVGNYGEVYDRNVGARSNLRIPRSLNALATQGGMQYAPPMR
ncbi:MAG: amino acid ABC transporter substrate-binding protein [Reyranellaceae bacterium]